MNDVRSPSDQVQELKTDPAVFQASWRGAKPFEIRRNDRDFQEGNLLRLRETQFSGTEMADGSPLIYTGRELVVEVTYVLRGPRYGLLAGWAILGVRRISSAGAHGDDTAAGSLQDAVPPGDVAHNRAELEALDHQLAEAQAALWRVAPNTHSLSGPADPFEGPGETYVEAYARQHRQMNAAIDYLRRHAGQETAETVAAMLATSGAED